MHQALLIFGSSFYRQFGQNFDLQDLDRILGLSSNRPAVVEEEVDLFLASGRVSDANLKRLLRRAEARLVLLGARSDAGYSGAATERSAAPKTAAPAPAPASARQAPPQLPQSVSEEELLKWSQVAKLANKELEMEVLRKKEAKKHAQTEIRTFLQQQIDEKNSKKQKAAEDERKFCHLEW